jgi:glycosyltransferase involved in cell wall biosynthesis
MVFTCHGLSNFLYPTSFPTMTRLRLNWLHRIAIRRASRILCVSEHTAHQLQHEMNVSPDRLTLAPHGVGSEFCPSSRKEAQQAVKRKFNIDLPFVLYMGKVQRLKNIARLIEAFHSFRQNRCPNMKLVLAGKILHEPFSLPGSGLDDSIIRLGHVSAADVPDLYRAAEMLVLPSLFESFGMPTIEAMGCGTPVITSNAGALPEICGDAAFLVNPYSVDDIAKAMDSVFHDPQLRESLVARGIQHAKRYSWQLAAQRTLDAYTQVFWEGSEKKVPSEQPAL